jgi:hypothetical protein
LYIFGLEHTYSKASFRPPRQDAANYRARVRGAWQAIVNTLLNEALSVSLSTRRESSVKSLGCILSATYSDLLAELIEPLHLFYVDKVIRASFVPEFFVATGNLVDPSED